MFMMIAAMIYTGRIFNLDAGRIQDQEAPQELQPPLLGKQ